MPFFLIWIRAGPSIRDGPGVKEAVGIQRRKKKVGPPLLMLANPWKRLNFTLIFFFHLDAYKNVFGSLL